jgi:hypothetical protein
MVGVTRLPKKWTGGLSNGYLDGVIPCDELNTVIHEVLHMVMNIPVTEEDKGCRGAV